LFLFFNNQNLKALKYKQRVKNSRVQMPGCNAPKASIQGNGSSSFLRIYIKGYTAVVCIRDLHKWKLKNLIALFIFSHWMKIKVQKKATTLKEALQNKLKLNNLNIDKCVAFIKESR
jgi:hypothetical protein